MEYPVIRKQLVRANKSLRVIQKESRKNYGKVKANNIKSKIFKVVKLDSTNTYLRLTSTSEIPAKQTFQAKEFMNLLQQSNLTGMSGSGFSTYQKIATLIESKAMKKNLIVNAVECDPGLLHDEWLLHNHWSEIMKGIEYLSECISFQGVYLASKELYVNDQIHCVQVPNRYPMGAEKILIEHVLGTKLSTEQIPAKEGILVLNVQTILALYEMIMGKTEVNSRYLTVADLTTGEAKVVQAEIGSNAASVLVSALGERKDRGTYLGGGAMMAQHMKKEDVITAQTNFIAYGEKLIYVKNAKCKNCGGCTRRCPMNIDVRKIVQLCEQGNQVEAKKYNVGQCIHCGTCSYVCRAGKNVTELIAKLSNK